MRVEREGGIAAPQAHQIEGEDWLRSWAWADEPLGALPGQPLGNIRRYRRVTAELAMALWQGLFDGDWTLITHADDGARRLLLARRAPASASLRRALSPREQRALKLAVLGHSTKHLAGELNVAISTASTLVSGAIRKLGLRSRAELTEIFGLSAASFERHASAHTFELEGDAYALIEAPLRRLQPPSGLTEAEREVVLGVLSAKSNAEIAQARRTSVHTVANQLRAVYTKLGISGRFELISAC